jgi:hypothetical protein
MDSKITTDDPRRWKKHYMTAKERCYHMSKGCPSFGENYDNIEWGDLEIVESGGEAPPIGVRKRLG